MRPPLVVVPALLCAQPVTADVGIQAGPRAGIELEDDNELVVGGELRLAFARSPLALSLSFDKQFVDDQTVYKLAATPLFDLPVAGRSVRPYVGAGLGVIRFAYDMPIPGVARDDNGMRFAVDLVGGVRFELPIAKPFVQATVSLGEIDLVTISAGVLFGTDPPARGSAPEPPRWMGTLYLDSHVAGDAETGRGGVGASVAYFWRRRIGFELDIEQHPHFFRDEDVASLVPERVDLDTSATMIMGNVIVPIEIPDAKNWRPFVVGGLGAIHAVFDAQGDDEYDRAQTNLAFDLGAGMMHSLTEHVGLRAELRYLYAIVDDDTLDGGYFADYDMWRASFGVTVGF